MTILFVLYNFRLQDIDGGFFEKFGSLLRHKSQLDEPESTTKLAPFLETRIGEEDESEVFAIDMNSNLEATAVAYDAPVVDYTETEEPEPGSGASSESEDNGNKMGRREEFIVDAVGMNVSVVTICIYMGFIVACGFR